MYSLKPPDRRCAAIIASCGVRGRRAAREYVVEGSSYRLAARSGVNEVPPGTGVIAISKNQPTSCEGFTYKAGALGSCAGLGAALSGVQLIIFRKGPGIAYGCTFSLRRSTRQKRTISHTKAPSTLF